MTLPPHSYMSMPIKIAGPLMNLNNSLKRQILFSSHRHERIIFPASRASSDRCLALVVIILLIFHHRDQNCQHFQIFTIFDGTLTESHRVAPIKVVTMTVSNGPDCEWLWWPERLQITISTISSLWNRWGGSWDCTSWADPGHPQPRTCRNIVSASSTPASHNGTRHRITSLLPVKVIMICNCLGEKT